MKGDKAKQKLEQLIQEKRTGLQPEKLLYLLETYAPDQAKGLREQYTQLFEPSQTYTEVVQLVQELEKERMHVKGILKQMADVANSELGLMEKQAKLSELKTDYKFTKTPQIRRLQRLIENELIYTDQARTYPLHRAAAERLENELSTKGEKVKQRFEKIIANQTIEQMPKAEFYLRLLELYAPHQTEGLRQQYEQTRENLFPKTTKGHYPYTTAEKMLRELEQFQKIATHGMKKTTKLVNSNMTLLAMLATQAEITRQRKLAEAVRSYDYEEFPYALKQLETALENIKDSPFAIFLPWYEKRMTPIREFYSKEKSE